MAKVTANWKMDDFYRDVAAAVSAGLDAGALVFVERTQLNLSRLGNRTAKTFQQNMATGRALLSRIRASRGPIAITKAQRRILKDAIVESRIGLVDPPGGMPRLRTGFLRRSISFMASAPFKRKIGPGSEVPYAAIHEFGGPMKGGHPYSVFSDGNGGTRIVWRKKGTTGKGVRYTKPYNMPARPYLRPAMLAAKDQAAEQFHATAKSVLAGKGWA